MAERPTPPERPPQPEFEQILRWKRNSTKVHWQLIDGSAVIGTITWWDQYAVQVKADDLGNVTIPKHSILWYREASEA